MMTHEEIYNKFMIEYDKANVLSSYPSLTEYEVATFLDKAYNAIIAQKVTGNNTRKVGFEVDVKAVEDIAPLIVRDANFPINTPNAYSEHQEASEIITEGSAYALNLMYVELPERYYIISAFLYKNVQEDGKVPMDDLYDNIDRKTRTLPIQLVSHQMAKKFCSNAYNLPWVKQPIGFIENERLYIIYDPIDSPPTNEAYVRCSLVYIKKPNTFLKDLSNRALFPQETGVWTLFKPAAPNANYWFECNDTVAEEVISLAITYALENIESNRLATKLSMRGLES